MVRPSKALAEARKLIAECGWVQVDMGSRERGLCLDGALAVAHGWPQEFDGASYDQTRAVLTGFTRAWFKQGPIAYNDRPGRTKEEVLGLLDRAATEAEREGK